MARTLREIRDTKGQSFYRGELAEKIAGEVERLGGFLSLDDLKTFEPRYVDPISTNYKELIFGKFLQMDMEFLS